MRTIAAVAACFALGIVPPAHAHFLRHGHLSLKERVAYFDRSVAHDRAQVKRDQAQLRALLSPTIGTTSFVDSRPLVRLIVHRARWHRHAFAWHRAQLERFEAKVRAIEARERAAALVPAHVRGWSCITIGAYPGAPHEGNGYNGSWTGPLGMTTPWMGHYPPGSDWVHSDVMAVYAIAERESAAQGFSDSWMRGQWPRTYPPCARFF